MPKLTSITFAVVVAALPLQAQARDATATELCGSMGTIARAIMKARQREVPMSEVMLWAEKIPEQLNKITKEIVIEAYGRPGWAVEKHQMDEIQSFGNKVEQVCYATRS